MRLFMLVSNIEGQTVEVVMACDSQLGIVLSRRVQAVQAVQ